MIPRDRSNGFFKKNGLSIVLLTLMVLFIAGQIWTGLHVYNEERAGDGKSAVELFTYLRSPHFRSALFENWESEFLQMGFYVMLTIWLRQKG